MEDPVAIIGMILYLVLIIAVFSAFIPFLTDISCSSYKAQIEAKDAEIASLKNEILRLNSTAEFYKQQYENLTTTNITKKDFQELQNSINQIQYQINNVNNMISLANQEIINIQNVKNIYFNFALSVAFNLLSIGFLLVDFAFFNFDLSRKITKFVLNKVKRKHEKQESNL